MHILYLLPEYPPASCGGIGTLYSRLLPWIASQGVKVSLITLDAGIESPINEKDGNIEIKRIPSNKGRWADIQNALMVAHEVRRLSECTSPPDLVKSTDWGNLLFFVPASIRRICRIEGSVGFFRRTWPVIQPTTWLIEKLTLSLRCEYFISCSQYAWDVTNSIYSLNRRPYSVINNIINVTNFIRPSST